MLDEESEKDISELWTVKGAVENLLVVTKEIIGIGTARNMMVSVTVEIFDTMPSLANQMDSWDQVAECGINVLSGKVVVMGGSDYFPDAIRILVSRGYYAVRIYWGNLNSLSEDGLSGEDNYRIILSRSEQKQSLVFIKRRALN